jgi:hypothetical protein
LYFGDHVAVINDFICQTGGGNYIKLYLHLQLLHMCQDHMRC